MDKALADLIKISNTVGKDTTLVQGGGGNTSVKSEDGKYLYIKASGTALKDMGKTVGWRRLRMESVLAILKDKNLKGMNTNDRENLIVAQLNASCDDSHTNGARPSVESHLHAILGQCVIHLHPQAVCSYVCAKDGQAALDKIFADEKKPPLWIPYTDPGYSLAMQVAKLVAQYETDHGKKPEILFLEKHGLFISANSSTKALSLVRKVIKKCDEKIKALPKPRIKNVKDKDIVAAKLAVRKALFDATGEYYPVHYCLNDVIAGFMARKDAKQLLAKSALTPDELVYANGNALWFDSPDATKISRTIKRLIDKGEKTSLAFVIKGLGLFVGGIPKVAETIRDVSIASMKIRAAATQFGGVGALTSRQRDFILNWESESFRLTVAGFSAGGTLKDRIAAVTGAGSGIGRGLAIGLARAGAMVALLDIDEKAAKETQSLIQQELPVAQTIVIQGNVTSEENVQDAFKTIIDTWGGFDIAVNAAGVAPAAPLVDMPVDKWRFALEVNLTGYFLIAREAARVMIQQDIGGNIINISSKSGIDASKNNTPYNATKAGELHMARGWALELGPHSIRVNCIAPGNVFQGSKIWNDDYIKVCAKKYGIKPDEVIPYYVNKTALRREIVGQDIADSVVFLCSDQSRRITGQVIVADGGQAMVR